MNDHTQFPSVDMSALEAIAREIAHTIQREANINAVFGEPKQLDDRKIIPVGQVSVIFGSGASERGNARAGDKEQSGTVFGGSAGGNLEIKVLPLGFIHEKEGGAVYSAIDHENEGVVGRFEHLLRSTLKRG
jgi:uncharacterized spore protein YtfJ